VLDVVGDLALAGAPVIGAFRSYRGGHKLNLALLEAMMRQGAFAWSGAAARPGDAPAIRSSSP